MKKQHLRDIQIIRQRKSNDESDIEDLEILSDTESERGLYQPFRFAEEFSDSDVGVQHRRHKNGRRVLESDHESSVDKEIMQNDRSALWYAKKDNEFANNPPPFLRFREIKIAGATPYSYFIQKFTNDIFKYIVQETIRYAVYCGKDSFNVNVSELKSFYVINIIMTYINYIGRCFAWTSCYS